MYPHICLSFNNLCSLFSNISTIKIYRPMATIRGMTYQTLIKLTVNFESQEHRRSLDSKLGHAENLLAVKTDDVECFFSSRFISALPCRNCEPAFPRLVK